MADIPEEHIGRSFAFGPFELVPQRQLLMRSGVPVRLGGRALDILTVLVERAGEVVGKREIIARVWPNTFVEDGNLKVNMNALRRALDAGDGAPPCIATVVGRGYRFVVPVDVALSREPDGAFSQRRDNNLPTATTRIIGRGDAVEAVRQDLAEARLVSIVGAGGIGKTTVSLAVAEATVGSRGDGVWLVELAALRDPALVPNAIAAAIGLSAHSANMLAALCSALRDTSMLIILDSCEHIIDGVATCVDRLLAAAPGVSILATSREPLRVRGERVRRLPGLAVPAEASSISARDALDYPAIELFVDRATDGREDFELSDADAPIVAAICRRLDGLALAIELAATRVDGLGVAGLLGQLDDRFRVLESRRGGPERHRTLLATIDWSHALLSEAERLIMRRIAVFAASFSLEAAIAVVGGDGAARSAIASDLASLASKSLLAAEIADGEMNYRLLDTVRAYGLEKLVASGELPDTRRRHAEHCIAWLAVAQRDVERLSRGAWLARYGGRIADVRSALNWGFTDEAGTPLAVRLTVAAIPFGKQVSLIEECSTAVETALQARFGAYRTQRDDLVLNLALGATVLHSRGPLGEVKTSLTRALHLAEQLADTDLQLDCLRGLSEYELWTGDSRAAMAVAESIRALETKGERAAAGDADAQTGSALSWLGALGAARQRLESIVYRPLVGDPRGETDRFEFDQRLTATGALATVLWLQGYADQAMETAKRQLRDAEASNYAVSLCCALLHGSLIVALYVRDYAVAVRHLERGLAHASTHGLSIWRNMGFCAGGRLKLYMGQPFDLAAYRGALAEIRQGGFRMRYPNYLTNYGEALARAGDVARGLAAIDEAIALCRESGQVVGIPEILRIKGNVIRFQEPSRLDSAAECYRQSIELARRDHALGWELRSATSLVKLARQQGGDDEAETMLETAFCKFTEGFETVDLRRARSLIETRRGH
ncbi:MAG TPA: winged helix-turn-helix domain-containing protein [Kaistia sp.]|nr:winged helix-turn-helix domain-containing protein [Kaistia sp.]